jgi:predicted GIY-YIG superfamily endonuclease
MSARRQTWHAVSGNTATALPIASQNNTAWVLVYAEWHDDILLAKQRERNIKHWRRSWKVELILKDNPKWKDLYDRLP